MRRAPILAVSVASLLLAAPAAHAAEPTIRPGVKAGGVDVGGLTLSAAAAKLDATFAAPLSAPLQVRAAGRRFDATPADVGFAFDAGRTARRANIAGREAQPAADGTYPVDVPLFTTTDAAKLGAFVDGIDAKTTTAPRDATLKITLKRLVVRKARVGWSVDGAALRRLVATTLADPAAPRILRAGRVRVHPKVNLTGLKRKYGTVVTVDRAHFKLRLFKRLKLSKSYGVAVGAPGYATPTGQFTIANKAVNPTWTAPDKPWAGAYRNESVAGGSSENPLKARWMGIVDGVGIHGTAAEYSIGSAASHGCIRMRVADVIDLYPRVPVGTAVLIK